MLGSQLLRHRLEKVVRRDRVEDVQDDHEEEDLEPNVDEVVGDEVLEVDVPQLSKTMSKRTMKLAKSMSMSEVVAKEDHREERDLVEEGCVEEVDKEMVMCRCGCGGLSLLTMGRGPRGIRALLPCRIPDALMGVPRWVVQKSWGSRRCHLSMHGRW